MLTYPEALDIVLSQSRSFGEMVLPIEESVGYVLTEQIFADRDYPPFHRAAMDGFAIRFQDWVEGIRKFEIVECIFAGQSSSKSINKGQCYQIMTGAATPADARSVIRVEDASIADNFVSFPENLTIKDFQNIAYKGEDVKAKTLVFDQGIKINPMVIGVLASFGVSKVKVKKTPKITIISTGDEIKSIDSEVNSVQIRDCNSYALTAFLKQLQIPVYQNKLIPDDAILLENAVKEGLQSEILIISGGVSAGEADFIPQILIKCGVKELFHKVQIKPGKPLWFGKCEETNTIVFALPGNPVSVQVAFKIFLEPFLKKCFDLPPSNHFLLPITKERIKKVKFDEFFPIKLQNQPHTSISTVKLNGSGDFISTSFSDGIAWHPASIEKLEVGDLVKVYLW